MNNTNKYRLFLLAALLITGLLSSCLKEDFTDCPRPFQVTVKALDVDRNDITESGAVQQVILFVFDENQQVIDAFELTADQVKSRKPVEIKPDYPGHKAYTVVAWGNLDEKVDFSQINTVKQMQDLYVKLKQQNGAAQAPGDLFYGSLNVPAEFGGIEAGTSQVVEITRKTASVIITARNFPPGEEASAYSFVLRESPDTYNQNGELGGDMVGYKLTATKDKNGQLVTPIFNVFPTAGGKPFVLDVYRNGELLYSFTKGSDGKEFTPEVGRLLNIIIDFRVDISVKVVITPWGEVYQEVEY